MSTVRILLEPDVPVDRVNNLSLTVLCEVSVLATCIEDHGETARLLTEAGGRRHHP